VKTAPLSDSTPARPTPGPMPSWTFPAAEPGRLGNGLATLRSHLPDRRLASVRLVLDAGAGREPTGLDGVANLTASALLEETEASGGTTLTAAFERLGAALHAGADLTALQIAFDVPVTRLADALPLLSSVIRSPALADADVGRLAGNGWRRSPRRTRIRTAAPTVSWARSCSRLTAGRPGRPAATPRRSPA
jgi:hypothetical protein